MLDPVFEQAQGLAPQATFRVGVFLAPQQDLPHGAGVLHRVIDIHDLHARRTRETAVPQVFEPHRPIEVPREYAA